MNIAVIVVVGLILCVILYEAMPAGTKEHFVNPRRSDIGYAADGWVEDSGYMRDMRYSEAFVDVQGLGVPTDFCRAVVRANDPETLQMVCALGHRDGMSTREYASRTKREGMRFSRDDYWRVNAMNRGRMDYCRVLRDEDTGEWYASCAIAGPEGFKKVEERDTAPPPAIRQILEGYDGALVWYRWRDDAIDYTGNTVCEAHGRPEWPVVLRPELTRGLQLNRWPAAAQDAKMAAPPLDDYLRWGESGTLALDQTVQPRQIRAISFWVWWDAFEKGARIMEASADGRRERMWLGVEGGGPDLPSPREAKPAQEVSPQQLLAVGQLTEPGIIAAPPAVPITHTLSPKSQIATYVFEIWDQDQRIMRLASPMDSAKTGRWQHVAVSVTETTDWWPTWQLWLDGEVVAVKADGRLSPALSLAQNYIGRRVRGCLQDFRVYSKPLTAAKIHAAIAWGRPVLHANP